LLSKNEITRTLKRKYILALTILTVVITFSQFVIYVQLQKQETDSRVINLAGRQRMLSQKITKDVLLIVANRKIQDRYLDDLKTSVDLWEQTHYGLINGDSTLGLPPEDNLHLLSLYQDIDLSFNEMLNSSRAIMTMLSNKTMNQLKLESYQSVVIANQSTFLEGMDKIVFEYDSLAQEKIDYTKKVELILFVIAILSIIFVLIFIFIPVNKKIHESIHIISEHEKTLNKLFDVSPNPLFLVNMTDFSILKINESAESIAKIDKESIINRLLYDFIPADYLENLKDNVNNTTNDESVTEEVMFIDTSDDSSSMIMTVNHLLFENEDTLLIGLTDISDRVLYENTLKDLATIDVMTSLYNRRTGLAFLDKELSKCSRGSYDMTFCFIDLDGLKKVNDQYGHTEGDWLIKTFSKHILDNIRDGDIAFRYGGDEISIIFPNSSLGIAGSVMSRIKESLSELNSTSDKSFNIAFSYGLVDYANNKINHISELIDKADALMYEDKKLKRQYK